LTPGGKDGENGALEAHPGFPVARRYREDGSALTMRLTGPSGFLSLTEEAWVRALELGHLYGWKPAGTEQPSPAEAAGPDFALPTSWDGRYFGRHGQRIAADDAQHFALALREALPDLADVATPQDYFSGERKSIILDLATLCEAGGVQIT